MARHPITGHSDRHRKNVISSRITSAGGTPPAYKGEPVAEDVDMARIAELEQTVKRLQGAIRGVIENRRQGL